MTSLRSPPPPLPTPRSWTIGAGGRGGSALGDGLLRRGRGLESSSPAHSRCHLNGAPGMSSALAGRTEASLQGQTHLPGSPPGQFTLLSLGPSGQAVGSSRLRSSPSRMDEDLSEFKEKASVSAS